MSAEDQREAWQRALALFRQYREVNERKTSHEADASLEMDVTAGVRRRLAKESQTRITPLAQSEKSSDEVLRSLISSLVPTSKDSVGAKVNNNEANLGAGARQGTDAIVVKAKIKGKEKTVDIPVRITDGPPATILTRALPQASPNKISLDDVKPIDSSTADAIHRHEAKLRGSVSEAFKDVKSGVQRNVGSLKEDLSDLKHGAASKAKGLKGLLKKTGGYGWQVQASSSGNDNGQSGSQHESPDMSGSTRSNTTSSGSTETNTIKRQHRRKSVRIQETPDVFEVVPQKDGDGEEIVRLRPKQSSEHADGSSEQLSSDAISAQATTPTRHKLMQNIANESSRRSRHSLSTSDGRDKKTVQIGSESILTASAKSRKYTGDSSPEAQNKSSENRPDAVYRRISELAKRLNEE